MFILRIIYMNGSIDAMPFYRFDECRDYYRNRISYSAGRVRRVEVDDTIGGGTRAIWDISWDAASQAAGLAITE